MNKNMSILILTMCATFAVFSCEKESNASKKDLPAHVQACMKIKKSQHEYTCIPFTSEEIKAEELYHFNERVAIVREILEKHKVPQQSITDEQADAMYRTEMKKAISEHSNCKQQ